MDNKPVDYVSGGFGLMSVPELSNQPIEITFVEENLAKSQKMDFLCLIKFFILYHLLVSSGFFA